MKIGLVRHFKVNHLFPAKTFLSKAEVISWFADYDNTTNLEYKEVNLRDIDWKACYSSTMIRAVNTASYLYKGKIHKIPELKELDILHQLPDTIRLPFLVWGILVRIQSLTLKNETSEFKRKISSFLEKILIEEENEILIVSHWFVMKVIREELLRRGFKGEKFNNPENGRIYIFESEISH
jgi:broad specificity phosphatase PhoE